MKRGWQIVLIAGLSLLIFGVVETQFHPLRKLFGGRPLGQRELAAYSLGHWLATQYPGKSVLVLSNPFSQEGGHPKEIYEYEKAGLRGLKRGFGTTLKIDQVVFPEVRPEFRKNPRSVAIDPGSTTPLSYIVTDESLDKAAERYPQAEILVSLIGLPINVRQTQTWRDSNRKLALLLPDLRMVGNQTAIRGAIRSRKLTAIVVNKPGAPPESQPMGKDSQMEFEQRFLLITPDTVDKYLQVYPRLF